MRLGENAWQLRQALLIALLKEGWGSIPQLPVHGWWVSMILLAVATPVWGEALPAESPSLVLDAETVGVENQDDFNLENLTPQPPSISGKAETFSSLTGRGLTPNSAINILPLEGNSMAVDAPQPSLKMGEEEDAIQVSQTEPTPADLLTPQPAATPNSAAEQLDLSPEIIENSPVLQRWLEEVPDVLDAIRNDPSFRTRLRLGYSQFPSTNQEGGFNVGVEDVFLGRSGLTVSADYQATFKGNRESVGADLRYYVRPLGSYVNFAPQVGYRYIETGNYSTDGVNVGARLMLALSRTGAADVSLTQSFVSPGSSNEVGITTLSVGYAVTRNLRLATDIQKQNSREAKDSRVGIVLEWMP
jgi:hypothetical protein